LFSVDNKLLVEPQSGPESDQGGALIARQGFWRAPTRSECAQVHFAKRGYSRLSPRYDWPTTKRFHGQTKSRLTEREVGLDQRIEKYLGCVVHRPILLRLARGPRWREAADGRCPTDFSPANPPCGTCFRRRSEPSNARSRPVAKCRAAARMVTAASARCSVFVSHSYRQDHIRTGPRRRCHIADRYHMACRNSPSV